MGMLANRADYGNWIAKYGILHGNRFTNMRSAEKEHRKQEGRRILETGIDKYIYVY